MQESIAAHPSIGKGLLKLIVAHSFLAGLWSLQPDRGANWHKIESRLVYNRISASERHVLFAVPMDIPFNF